MNTIHPIKRLCCLMSALLLLLTAFSTAFAEAVDVIPEPTISPDAAKYDPEHPEELEADQLYAASAILIEADSGEVIFEKNADQIMYPASTTKIMTVMLGLMMADDLDEMITVSPEAMNIPEDSSTMSLKEGEIISLRDVFYGTMMVSANEGANIIAETTSGSIPAFVDMMNSTAQMIGCQNTHFVNPHGYHDDDHYTTARDMAIIAREAMKDETFRDIVGTVSYAVAKTNVHRARSLSTRSRILIPPTEESANRYYYGDATGIKTGSTSKAGYCFVSSASREGVDLISVVFYTSSSGRWTDTKKLFEYGFSQYVSVTPIELYNMNPITIETSSYSTKDSQMGKLQLNCVSVDGANVEITATYDEVESMASNLTSTMYIEYVRNFAAPITAGDVVATMTYFPDNGPAVTYNLIASRSVAARENAPKSIAQIVAETDADPNRFPPITAELVIMALLPFILLGTAVLLIRRTIRRIRKRNSRVPKPKSRFLK